MTPFEQCSACKRHIPTANRLEIRDDIERSVTIIDRGDWLGAKGGTYYTLCARCFDGVDAALKEAMGRCLASADVSDDATGFRTLNPRSEGT